MKHLFRTMTVTIVALFAGACASQQPASDCALTAAELDQLKADALGFLRESRPDLDVRCEVLSDRVVRSDPGKCAISGEHLAAESCNEPAHAGFSIVFDRETLIPEEIYFKTE